jgi:hypothetical protein
MTVPTPEEVGLLYSVWRWHRQCAVWPTLAELRHELGDGVAAVVAALEAAGLLRRRDTQLTPVRLSPEGRVLLMQREVSHGH